MNNSFDGIENEIEIINKITDDSLAIEKLENLFKSIDDDGYHIIINMLLMDRYEREQKFYKVIELGTVIDKSLLLINQLKLNNEEQNDFILVNNVKLAYGYQALGLIDKTIEIYVKIIKEYENNPNLKNKSNLILAYQGLGYIYVANSEKQTNKEEEIKLLELAKSYYEKIFNINESIFSIYPHLALINDRLGNNKEAIKFYSDSITKPMKYKIDHNIFKGTYYKYYTLNRYNIVDFFNRKLFFNDPKKFNDPFDCPIFRGNIYKKYNLFSKTIDKIRITCFSKRFNSTLMWSHYADSHKGVCIGFEIDSEFCKSNDVVFQEVDYQEKNPINKPIKDFRSLLNEVFFIKNKDWEYEKEVRMVGFEMKDCKIGIPNITEVIFGLNTSDEDKGLIRNIFSNEKKIKYRQVIDDEFDNINLKLIDV